MKVYPFRIPKKPGENIILQIDRGPRFYDKLHQHEEIQLSLIISGKGKLIVGNSVTTFSEGEFVAIGSHIPHLFLSASNTEASHMVSLFFTKESFGKDFFDNREMQKIQPLWEQLSRGFKVIDRDSFIKELFIGLNKQDSFLLFTKLLELLHYLINAKQSSIIQSPHAPKISKEQGQRLQLVFDYAMQNFHREIRLEDVAQLIYMGKNSFCRFFKQRTNKTFFEFLAEIRIQHACELIEQNSELPITAIATQSGYHTISNFNRHFKKIAKMNPKAYRDKHINLI